ncbi:lytic transglycosylase domain-containing protein [Rhizobium tubonense]|uniref:Transglycosylase n=1 Tax=Rhizobium tubonense TaxID=484088 RepID=A0A2W4CTG3_9HYPH|nr:lytic transglycosylase domain-containing protein [Rhizobium tubonense]PZM13655.1 transglycosylase [Rhizobium tubonense]
MAMNGFSSLKRSFAYSAILCGALAGCASTDQHASKAELSPAQANVPHPATASTPAGVASTSGAAAATTVASVGSPQNDPATALPKSGRVQTTTAINQSPHGSAPITTVETAKIEPGQINAAQDRLAQTQSGPSAPQSGQAQVAIAAATGATTTSTSASAAYAPSDQPPIPTMVAIPTPNPARPGDMALQPVGGSAVDTAYAPIPLTPEMVAIQSVVPIPRPGEAPGAEATMVASATPSTQLPGLSYADARPHYDYNFDTTGPTVIPAVLTEGSEYDSNVPPAEKSYITQLIQKYAKLYQVPAALIHRVVHRESRYDPKAYNNAGYFGLMQIKYNTAKSMGYQGPASGLFDAETNIKYAAKYLSGAWKVADNKQDDAVHLYARGYYYDAKNKGMMDIATGNY